MWLIEIIKKLNKDHRVFKIYKREKEYILTQERDKEVKIIDYSKKSAYDLKKRNRLLK